MVWIKIPARKRNITIPEWRYWAIVKLCRLLHKFAGQGGPEETWTRTMIGKDGSQEHEFHICVILPKKEG